MLNFSMCFEIWVKAEKKGIRLNKNNIFIPRGLVDSAWIKGTQIVGYKI